MKLIVATKNLDKLKEIQELLLGFGVELESLLGHPNIGEIVEDGKTFLENARKKTYAVRCVSRDAWILADDSGLVVEALGGEPGIHSARYAGRQGDYVGNNAKLLYAMRDVPRGQRKATFICAMVLVAPDGKEWNVEGRLEGEIGAELRGTMGFGFDPLFFVPKEGKTVAELSMAQKNKISHRGWALRQIREILVEVFSKKKDL